MRKGVLSKRLEKRLKIKDKYKVGFPDLKVREAHSLSNNISFKGGFKKDKIQEHLWKKGSEEKSSTVKEIVKKKSRIRQQFSKGAYQYSTEDDNSGPIKIYQK